MSSSSRSSGMYLRAYDKTAREGAREIPPLIVSPPPRMSGRPARGRFRGASPAHVQMLVMWLVLACAVAAIFLEWAKLSPSRRESAAVGEQGTASLIATDVPLPRDDGVNRTVEPTAGSVNRRVRVNISQRRTLFGPRRADTLQSNRAAQRLRRGSF